MKSWILGFTFAALGLAQASQAATFYADAVSYNAAAPDASAVVLPNIGAVGAGGFDAGGLNFQTPAPRTILSGTGGPSQWSTLIAGPEIAISGTEVLNVYGSDLKSISFDIHEPTRNGSQTNFTDTCNATCVQSTFRVSIFAGTTLLDFIDISPIDDALTFVGLTSSVAFDRLQVMEIIGTADNEFFGNFTVSSFTPVPLPASLPLALVGFGAFAIAGRRRKA